MLSGKNKEKFEKWLETQRYGITHDVGERQPNIVDLANEFKKLPLEMQKGVYEKYFKSINYRIEISIGVNWKTDKLDGYDFRIYKLKENIAYELYVGCNAFELKAFSEAVKQLDKLINDEL